MAKSDKIVCIIGLFKQTENEYAFLPYVTAYGVVASLKLRESLRHHQTGFTYLSVDMSPQLWVLTGCQILICNLDAPRT